jgi:hypothetical protein
MFACVHALQAMPTAWDTARSRHLPGGLADRPYRLAGVDASYHDIITM